ncbi:MAG TPA: sialate O-acetylesterase, partial [Candidatus Hydrogenedentes bacterium]|nr:sialate O-acetylesterase [Candidatus Hydrogenedentota bacterium]
LYGSMLKQVEVAGGKVRGVLWYQAESDANPEKSAEFKQKFIDFVAAIREDFGDPNLPFYYVQIGRFVTPSPTALSWNRIQQLQLECEALIPNSGVVASIDLALDDLIHAGTPGLKTLGARLASLAERDLYGGKTLRGPRPVEVTRRETPYGKQMLVKFREVNGRLVAPGRPAGFFVTAGPEGAPVPTILNQEISSESPDTVILWYWQDLPEDAQLWYGWGFDPYCNISDEAGMAVPVFGPMPIP